MTSIDERKPKFRRGLLWPAIAVVVLFCLYSAGWFWLAGRVRAEADNAIASLNKQGIDAECADMAVSGYPLALHVSCDSLAYEDDGRNVAASSGGIETSNEIYWPMRTTADLDGPLRTAIPGMSPLWIDWDKLQATVGLSWPLPSHVAVTAEGLSGQTDPQDDSDPAQLFSAGVAAGQLTPNGHDLDYSGGFTDLEIDPGAIGGRTLPPLDGSGDLTLNNGVALLAALPASLRGQSVTIRRMELSSGEARVAVSGPISVDAEGLVDANLTIRLQNPKAVSAILAGAIPEKRSEIEQGFGALALLGNQQSMPLRVAKGKASLGFIPLGRIKPLD